MRDLGIEPIVGLVHHGSGPAYTSLVDDGFADGLAEHARAVAERFPWVEAYTPVNEPLTTARFSGLYGHWYPHGRSGATYARALMNEIRATVLSMAAIREVNPNARLVQTEDLGKSHATERLRYQAEFENMRRWVTWDLLCGRVDREHPMWGELRADGIAEKELEWHLEHPCPPDLIGINYYVTSERFLDHRIDRYPPHMHGGNAFEPYVDVEAVRVLAGGIEGAAGILREAWERYGLPIAITECHLGCTREEQARWLLGVWRQAQEARAQGRDVRAVTVWSMFGAFDWCSLLTRHEGRYEPGVFDLRAPTPRPTALTGVVRSITSGTEPPHEAYRDDGWWERPIRLLYEPALSEGQTASAPAKSTVPDRRPLLIVGARGALGQAFGRLCELRGLEHRLVSREEMDLSDVRSVAAGLAIHRPWAVVNAAGYSDVDAAERDQTACWRDNAAGAINLAIACAHRDMPLVTFSSSMVFDGMKPTPYVESDPVRPLGVFGQSKARAEQEVLREHPGALIVRTGPLFGSGARQDVLMRIVHSLTAGRPHPAASDVAVSPTFLPDLVHGTLDLLLDGAAGLIHLANRGQTTWAEFARTVAHLAGLDAHLVEDRPAWAMGGAAARPANSSLESERAWCMPTLDDALARMSQDLRIRDEEGRSPLSYLA